MSVKNTLNAQVQRQQIERDTWVLTEIDYRLLEFIRDNTPVSPDTILATFPDEEYNTVFRIKIMERKYLWFAYGEVVQPDGSKRNELLNAYTLTPRGKTVLQNHQIQYAKDKRQWCIDMAWKFAPIAISIVALVKSFLPEIRCFWQMLQQVLYRQ